VPEGEVKPPSIECQWLTINDFIDYVQHPICHGLKLICHSPDAVREYDVSLDITALDPPFQLMDNPLDLSKHQ
jgi:hypothetical protein